MKKYNTIINFVEPTMLLKRVTVDTFNNTYPLGHDYSSGASNAIYGVVVDDDKYPPQVYGITNTTYKTIYSTNSKINIIKGRIVITFIRSLPTGNTYSYVDAPSIILTIYVNNTAVFSTSYASSSETQNDVVYTLDCSNYANGSTVKIEYKTNGGSGLGGSYVDATITYGASTSNTQILIIDDISKIDSIKLNAVCDRLFKGSLGRRENDPVPFKLDTATEQWFSTITAPEYCFTRSTLYEVLMEIGGTKEVNAVPRLLWNEETNAFDTITFIKQGDSTDEYTLPSGVKLTGEEVDINADEYCEEFDSYAENMVNTLDAQRGSIHEPSSRDGADFKAAMSEDLTITDNTAIISTSKPIYRVIKLIVNYSLNEYVATADFTPYVFEAAEYDNLTSYDGTYPYAKEWALRYAQGDNKITGLCLKQETVTDLGSSFTKMAFWNILSRILGQDVNGSIVNGIAKMSFNITYIPINTVRVKQRKAYMEWKGSGTQIYNQGGNVVEADYYGNHLKNRLARIGNPIKKYTFRLKENMTAPKIGQVFYDEEDGELLYISQVDEEIGLTYTLITMWLTRNVNRLYNYTAVNSRKRQYAIDERMSVDRHVNISENIYIGDNVTESDTSMNSVAIEQFMDMFKDPLNADASQIKAALVRGINGNNYITNYWIWLPITMAAMGNSLYFGFRFKDNYSAGDQSVALSGSKRLVRALPYGDDNGMIDYLDVRLCCPVNSSDKYDLPEYSVDENILDRITFSSSSTHGRIPVYKDSRDILHIDIQEHFIATRRSLMIGSELAYCNRLINGTSDTFGVAFLPYRLNEQRETLTIQDSYKAGNLPASAVTISGRKATISARTNTTGAAAKSWAIYNKANNRLVIGENMDIAAGGTSSQLVFNF